MAPSKIPSHENISKADFREILEQYPSLIETLSKSKPAKRGQSTLQELDEYRFVTAPDIFGQPSPRPMNQQDVETLVQWKLRHGKFRPTLMALVSSNPPDLTSRTIASAIQTYRKECSPTTTTSSSPSPSLFTDSILAAVGALAKLRGIGPATASLLLAVHDAPNIVFFSDEAFQWLCGEGAAAVKIKYSVGEYRDLCDAARALARRLDVTPMEIEKVAYVLVKRQGAGVDGGSSWEGAKRAPVAKRKALGEDGDGPVKKADAKTEVMIKGEKGRQDAPVRRSQRLKK